MRFIQVRCSNSTYLNNILSLNLICCNFNLCPNSSLTSPYLPRLFSNLYSLPTCSLGVRRTPLRQASSLAKLLAAQKTNPVSPRVFTAIQRVNDLICYYFVLRMILQITTNCDCQVWSLTCFCKERTWNTFCCVLTL